MVEVLREFGFVLFCFALSANVASDLVESLLDGAAERILEAEEECSTLSVCSRRVGKCAMQSCGVENGTLSFGDPFFKHFLQGHSFVGWEGLGECSGVELPAYDPSRVAVRRPKFFPRDWVWVSAVRVPKYSYKLMMLAAAALCIDSEMSPYMLSSTW